MKYKFHNTSNSKVTIRNFMYRGEILILDIGKEEAVDTVKFMVSFEQLKKVFPNITIERIEDNFSNQSKIKMDEKDNMENLKSEETLENLDKLMSLSKKKLISEARAAGLDDSGTVKDLATRLNDAGIQILED